MPNDSLTPEARDAFLAAWNQTGIALLDDSRVTPPTLDLITKLALPRLLSALPGTGIGVATPCRDTVQEETHRAITRLAFDFGMAPRTAQGFSVTVNRELLLNAFIDAGYRKLLFLDSDTFIGAEGVWQLVSSMERWRAAMMCALVPIRLVGALGQYNAFLEDGVDEDGKPKYVAVTREHLPQSLTEFPVKYAGMACCLLDLEQIREFPGPRFESHDVGVLRSGEDTFFNDWLRKNGLDFYCDPKVSTVHITNNRLGYAPTKAE